MRRSWRNTRLWRRAIQSRVREPAAPFCLRHATEQRDGDRVGRPTLVRGHSAYRDGPRADTHAACVDVRPVHLALPECTQAIGAPT